MAKEVEIFKLRDRSPTTGETEYIFEVICRCERSGGIGVYTAAIAVPVRDATPERERIIREALRRSYLDHRGQKH